MVDLDLNSAILWHVSCLCFDLAIVIRNIHTMSGYGPYNWLHSSIPQAREALKKQCFSITEALSLAIDLPRVTLHCRMQLCGAREMTCPSH